MPTRLVLDTNTIQYKVGDLTCILSGATPCALREVGLRHMWFVGVAWVGESTAIKIPIANFTGYPVLQYLRTFRWIICLLLLPVLNYLELSLDYQWVKSLCAIAIILGAWFGIGWILKKEKIRLVKIERERNIIHLQFTAKIIAERLKAQLLEGMVIR